ncbi:3-isopropylmalate dehydratase small subunit [Salipiger mucosus]|uniref:3-isopropylmalate dehydratase n=1 Tax=Salipiger mucosus DSM 16094 TaxID=1123237 RepID=S9QZN0_9RHOB|nr:3-isopropylmalate dehydratase small subunit [Salipiger mucosus]EPX85118.1 3-isopropylmalate dehydratase small subunit [Salipiger mucosus DSM 16094]
MPGWTVQEGRAVALPLENVDTDQLIPARFMSTPRSEGYGGFLLHDLRHDAEGQPDPDFPLNAPGAEAARILVTRRNFGAGSSREAAVYALVDAGFRVVIAPSFGDIFSSNAVNNGLLPAQLDAEAVETLLAACPCEMRVDLEAGTISAPGGAVGFTLDRVWRQKLMNGWDDIDLTLAHDSEIGAFAETRKRAQPWTWPA